MTTARNWWAFGLALCLHGALAWFVWPSPPLRPATAQSVVITAFLLPPPPESPPPPSLALGDAAPLAAPAPLRPTPPVPRRAEIPPQPSIAAADLPKASPEPAGYLASDEVDQPAAPIGDWVIDADILPRGTALHLVIRLWVSATGRLDRWELEGSPENEALARRALENLDRTAIRPALLNHIAVPNLQRIEVVVSRE